MQTPDSLNQRLSGTLPGTLGVTVTDIGEASVIAEIQVLPMHMAPNGFLHAGSVVTLADTASGLGCVTNLPQGASGFTTIELKSNHVGTARDGTIVCTATAAHLGRTTQVWDAEITHRETGRKIAIFRCTQMVLYAKDS
jgi:uncharacterized protein (TIGR00369 family)